jgi:hypothetical protein
MNDSSYADKINKWQITLQNFQEALPGVPGAEPRYNELRERVDVFRESQETVQRLRGQLTEAVVRRRQYDLEARRSARGLAAVARAHFGFANPMLETFNIRSEHRAHHNRKQASKPAPQG